MCPVVNVVHKCAFMIFIIINKREYELEVDGLCAWLMLMINYENCNYSAGGRSFFSVLIAFKCCDDEDDCVWEGALDVIEFATVEAVDTDAGVDEPVEGAVEGLEISVDVADD